MNKVIHKLWFWFWFIWILTSLNKYHQMPESLFVRISLTVVLWARRDWNRYEDLKLNLRFHQDPIRLTMIRIDLIDLCCVESLIFDYVQNRRYCSLLANDCFDVLIVHWLKMILVKSQMNKSILHRNQPIQCLLKTTETKTTKKYYNH